MNIITLLQTMRDAIASDSTIESWCIANYHRSHKVYLGMDHRDPPDVGDYPLIHLYPTKKITGWDLDRQEFRIGATCGLCDDDLRQITSSNVIEYESIQYVEDFRKYVENAIKGAMPTGFRITKLEIDYDGLELFPFLLVGQEYTIFKEQYQGSDAFE